MSGVFQLNCSTVNTGLAEINAIQTSSLNHTQLFKKVLLFSKPMQSSEERKHNQTNRKLQYDDGNRVTTNQTS